MISIKTPRDFFKEKVDVGFPCDTDPIRDYVLDVLLPIWVGQAELDRNSPVWSSEITGHGIVLDFTDNLFEANKKLYFDESGIRHTCGGEAPCWEAVTKKGEFYIILMLMNNEFGITYFLHERLAPEKLKQELDEAIENDNKINLEETI